MSKKSFIADLLKYKEDFNIEFKIEYELNRILEIVCSFLNTEGGWLLIGYSGKEVVGIQGNITEKIKETEENIVSRISPQPLVYIKEEQYKGKNLLLINVLKGARQPYSLDKKYFIRKGSTTVNAEADDISLLLRTSNDHASTWEKMNLSDANLKDLNSKEVNKTIEDAEKTGRGKNLPSDIEEFLSYFQLTDFGKVSNGAMTLFGKNPAKFIPQCRIRITVMPLGKTGRTYSDMLTIEDNLFDSFNKLMEYFKKNLPMISEFKEDNWNRIVREKFPLDALDEAVVNAMVHRDYADFSGEITINIYQDNMEIINSGEIPPDIIIGKNKIKPHHSIFRNPSVAHVFWLRKKMEKEGRGLSLIKQRFEEYGLKLPEWSSKNGYTTLTLYSTPAKSDIAEGMIRFLKKFKPGESFSREDYENSETDKIPERTARSHLSKMVNNNLVKKAGKGQSTRYIRTSEKLPEITG